LQIGLRLNQLKGSKIGLLTKRMVV
jgi:hypothetical protein